MKKEQRITQCPFLGEVVMDYCEAYPVRKPIPKHQISTPSPCVGAGHKACPAFLEIVARIHECPAGPKPPAVAALASRRR